MSSVGCLREFVSERLTAAAEEIFRVFEKTIIEYEEEICRQRRLLGMCCQPEIKLHRIELPHQHVCTEEEVLADQQLCNEERSSSLDQEDPEPPQMKEEQEEVCTSQEGEQLVLKQETETSMLIPTFEESDHQLLFHSSYVAENRDQKGGEHGGATRNAELKPQKRNHKSKSCGNNVNKTNLPETHCNIRTCKKSFICESCGKDFKFRSKLNVHLRVHTGEKPFSCDMCGKSFGQRSGLNAHIKLHRGERPYACVTCGKDYRYVSELKAHMRTHKYEKSPKTTKTKHSPLPQPVHPPAVCLAIQKHPSPYNQTTEQLLPQAQTPQFNPQKVVLFL